MVIVVLWQIMNWLWSGYIISVVIVYENGDCNEVINM